jgi:hypothetical protein
LPAATSVQTPAISTTERRDKRAFHPFACASAAIVSALLFATINIGLLVRFGDERASARLSDRNCGIGLAVDGFKALPHSPRVVFLGSSLIMFPIWALDKLNDMSLGDIFHHRQSQALSAMIGRPDDKEKPIVYNLGIYGQMVSDAYIYANELLKADKTPEYLVYAIAPRDFHDFDLPAPMASNTFKCLVGLDNFYDYAALYLPSFQDKADWTLGRACYFYGHRWRLQRDVLRSIDRAYTRMGLPAAEAAIGEPQGGFSLAGNEDERWQNSIHEYQRRYKDIGGQDYELQFSFLERLLTLCHQRGIKPILLNMPLTLQNRSLLGAQFYEDYRRRAGAVATKYGAEFIDVGTSAQFKKEDFCDSVHLNQLGGRKLLEKVAERVR